MFVKTPTLGLQFSGGTRSYFSLVSHGLLLATSYPSGHASAKSFLITQDNGEYGDIDSSKTLKYISEEIGKIRELLDSAEFSLESRIFRATIAKIITDIQDSITICSNSITSDYDWNHASCQTDEVLLRQLKAVILQNLTDAELDVDRLSDLLNMSRRNLFRRIKSTTGLSPGELINEIRLRTAREMLQCSDLKMYEIADRVGFRSRIVFTRNFARLFGVSPTEFLKKHNRKHDKLD